MKFIRCFQVKGSHAWAAPLGLFDPQASEPMSLARAVGRPTARSRFARRSHAWAAPLGLFGPQAAEPMGLARAVGRPADPTRTVWVPIQRHPATFRGLLELSDAPWTFSRTASLSAVRRPRQFSHRSPAARLEPMKQVEDHSKTIYKAATPQDYYPATEYCT